MGCITDSDAAAVLSKAHEAGLDARPEAGRHRRRLVVLAVDRHSELVVLLVDRSGMGWHCISSTHRHLRTKASRPLSDRRAGRCGIPHGSLRGRCPAGMRAHRRFLLHASLSDCSYSIPEKDQSPRGPDHGGSGDVDGGEFGTRRSRAAFRGGAEQEGRHSLALRPMPKSYGVLWIAVRHRRRRVAPIAACCSVDNSVACAGLDPSRALL